MRSYPSGSRSLPVAIKTIETNAEKALLGSFESAHEQMASCSVLFCQFTHIKATAKPEMLLPILSDIFKEQDALVYFLYDGDAIIIWKGYHDQITKGLMTTLTMLYKDRFTTASKEQVFRFFEPYEHENEVIAICRGKIIQKEIGSSKPETAPPPSPPPKVVVNNLVFSQEQIDSLNESMALRKRRRGIEILVVEDQGFSRKLLTSMLERNTRCREAATADEAIKLYATYALDICFLDIDLPDASGHALAYLFRNQDPGAYLVMVTANKLAQDVEIALKNNVQGFIYKPFSKNRIFEIVNNVIKRNNKITA